MEQACSTNMKTAVFRSTWSIIGFSTIKADNFSSAIFTGTSANTASPVYWYFNLYPKKYTDDVLVEASIKVLNERSNVKFHADVEIELNTPAINNPTGQGNIATGYNNIGSMKINRSSLIKYLLKDGTLTLRFKISLHEIVAEMQKPLKILHEDSKLLDHYASLLTSGENFSDTTVVIGQQEFPVHRAILAARSPVFAAMFKHTNMKESQQKRVTINDLEPNVFQEVLRFIYTDTVSGLEKMAHELLVAADKYALDRLMNMCEEYLGGHLSTETVVKTLHLADMHRALQLRQAAVRFIAENIKALQTEDWKNLLVNSPDVAAEMFSELAKMR